MRPLAILIAILVSISPAYSVDDLMIRGDITEFANGSTVIWTPLNFAGFYYDIDKGLGAEVLQLKTSEQSVPIGDAVYGTSAQKTRFEHGEWGLYRVLSFLGEIYFVGYSEDCIISPSWSSLGEDGALSKILIDSDSRETVSGDQDLLLEEGYKLRFSDSEEGVKVALYKGSAILNTATINPPETYVYAVPVGDRNITLIAVHVTGSVKLKPSSYYTIKGMFQISENFIDIEPGSKYGMMEVSSISGDGISMTNFQEIDLSPNSDVDLMDGIRLKTADSSDLTNRLYIYRNISDPGTHEVRGPVGEVGPEMYVVNPQNFAGFHYNIDDDLGAETLTMNIIGNALEMDTGVIYEAVAQKKAIEFRDWGDYWTMGFLGENYFAGYVSDGAGAWSSHLSTSSDDANLLANEGLSRVLIDSAEPRSIRDGDVIALEEGLAAKFFVDNECETVFLELYKDDNLVRRDYFRTPDTYVYTMDVGDSQNVAVLAIHIAGLDCTGDRTCVIDGIWQISAHPISIEVDTEYDKMTLLVVDPYSMRILMNNDDTKIILNKNKDQLLVDDIRIKTANQAEISSENPLRFYIYREATVES
jgi:S-layer protein (TIGR01567 family)